MPRAKRVDEDGARLLLVEDDPRVAGVVRRGLRRRGFSVDVARDGREGLHRALAESYDVVVLDLMLPFMDGMDILRRIRDCDSHTRVLILSARAETADRIGGLDSGADDYLVKPFDFGELTARIRALLRRASQGTGPTLTIGDLEIDLLARTVERAGRPIHLTSKEFALLEYLVRSRDNVVTRQMIAERVWNQHFGSFGNLVDVYVCHLRAKIDKESPTKLIHTVRGVGYVASETPP